MAVENNITRRYVPATAPPPAFVERMARRRQRVMEKDLADAPSPSSDYIGRFTPECDIIMIPAGPYVVHRIR